MDMSFIQPLGTYTAAANGPIGQQVRSLSGKRWMYTRFLDAVTYVIGAVCQPGTTLYSVTNDVAGGSGTILRFAGCIPNLDFAGNAITSVPVQNDYGYVQLDGYHSAVKTNGDDDIALGDTVIMVATDGVADSITGGTTTGTLLYIGTAWAADVDAANTVATNLKCFYF